MAPNIGKALSRRALAAAISLAIASGSSASARAMQHYLPTGEVRPATSHIRTSTAGARSELVFVDRRLPDYLQLVGAVSPDAEIHLIDGDRSGIEQIALAVSGRSGIDAIHLLSHGDDGVLLLGGEPLHTDNLPEHETALRAVGAALAPDGDILLYGCNVVASHVGEAFVVALAAATGADVAASGNITGSSASGGDWDLEIAIGDVAAAAVLDADSLASYPHDLATFSASTIGELRTALATSAENNEPDTITLTADIRAAGFVDMLASPADGHRTFVAVEITDGETVEIIGGGHTIDANYYGRVLGMCCGTVSITDLTLTQGLVSGNGGDAGMDGGSALGGAIRNDDTLTLNNVLVTRSGAAGGGAGDDGGGVAAGGGGGGGGLYGIGGGNGGTGNGGDANYDGGTGGDGFGGDGGSGAYGGFSEGGGRGGSVNGGAGGVSVYIAGAGGRASNGSLSIGGGGGGSGSGGGTFSFLYGGSAAGAIYNAGLLTILGSTVSNNVGAGGGASHRSAGGIGVGGIWNAIGATARLDSTSNGNLASNAGGGGRTNESGSGADGHADILNLGWIDTNYSPPSASNLTQNVTYTEDPGDSVALGDIVVTDPDGGDTITATLTLGDPAAGVLTTGTFGSASSMHNAGSGLWTVVGSLTDINAALAAVAFTPAANRDQDVIIYTRIRDAADTGPDEGTITLEVTPVNDAPTATNLTQTVTYAGNPGASVALGDIVVTDPDTGDILSAMLTLSNPAAGLLTTGTFGSATSTHNADSGLWTVIGSVTDVTAALAAVGFTPVANWDQDVTIATRIRDAANTGPADGTIMLDVSDATDLQIAKDNGLDRARDGQVLVYAITVANVGPLPVTGARLADNLPANLVEAAWACLPDVSNTPCPPSPFEAGVGDLYAEIDLPVGGFLRYDLTARVQAGAGVQVSNTATVSPPDDVDEFDPSSNSATDTTLIVPEGVFADGFEASGAVLKVPAAAKAQRGAAGR